jgi:signal transduction histidine kinase/DNA-binding NarL/FixJ family response regulator
MNQKLLLILIFCLVGNIVNGQDFSLLKTKVKKMSNKEEQLDAYITLIDTLIWYEQELDECKFYIKKANELAVEYGSKNDRLNINLLSMRRDFYTNEGDVVKWIEENKATYLQLKPSLLKAKYFLFIGIVRENKALGGLKGGLPDFLRAKEIYEAEQTKNNYDKYLLDTYLRLVCFYRYSVMFDSSTYYLNQGLQLKETLKEPLSGILFSLEQLEHYRLQAKYSEGIQLCLEWLNGKEGNLSFENEIAFREQLMVLYLDNIELDKAIDVGEVLISIIQKKGVSNRIQKKIMAYTCLRIGIANIEKHEYQVALTFLDKALDYKDNLSKRLLVNEVLSLKLEAYIGLKDNLQIEKLLYEYLNRTNILGIKGYRGSYNSSVLISICFQLYLNTNFKPSPKLGKVLSENIQFTLDNTQVDDNDNEITLTAYRLRTLLTIIKSGNKQLKEDFIKAVKINEQLNNTRNEQATKNLLIQYQTKEKEQQIQLQKLELNKKNTQRNIIISISLMLLLIGMVIVWYFKNKNKILQKDLQAKERIAVQSKELKRLNEQQKRLFNNIAHELRTPLTLIHAPIHSIIQKTKNTSIIQKDLLVAKRNINYLQQMVNQILDLSKIQNKQFSINVSSFMLNDLLDVLYNDFEPLAKFKKIDFQFLLSNKAMEIVTDGDKLFIILKNLLSNAFKYTLSEGAINVMVVDLGEELQIVVEDNGKGISKTDLPNVFDYYFQTHDETKLLEGGTGIGLTICKEYLKSMKGTIQVQSELGNGTSFIVTIPKKIEYQDIGASVSPAFLQYKNIHAIPIENQTTPTKPNPDFLHLLIVEDNLEIANYLESVLRDTYHLTFANNGKEALATLENVAVDLIITDLMMPVMNGYELIETLKKTKKWQKIPIITLTALGEMAHKIKALRIGVDEYLVKPFDNEELCLRIQNLLQNKMNREQYIEEISHVSDSQPNVQSNNNEMFISSFDTEWLEDLEITVKQNINSNDFNVSQLCLKLGMSSSQLYRKIKSLTGLAPREYINEIRYTTARKLLENNSFHSIKRVAYEVGVKDEKYFSRNFKKRFGKYPSEYLMERDN